MTNEINSKGDNTDGGVQETAKVVETDQSIPTPDGETEKAEESIPYWIAKFKAQMRQSLDAKVGVLWARECIEKMTPEQKKELFAYAKSLHELDLDLEYSYYRGIQNPPIRPAAAWSELSFEQLTPEQIEDMIEFVLTLNLGNHRHAESRMVRAYTYYSRDGQKEAVLNLPGYLDEGLYIGLLEKFIEKGMFPKDVVDDFIKKADSLLSWGRKVGTPNKVAFINIVKRFMVLLNPQQKKELRKMIDDALIVPGIKELLSTETPGQTQEETEGRVLSASEQAGLLQILKTTLDGSWQRESITKLYTDAANTPGQDAAKWEATKLEQLKDVDNRTKGFSEEQYQLLVQKLKEGPAERMWEIAALLRRCSMNLRIHTDPEIGKMTLWACCWNYEL